MQYFKHLSNMRHDIKIKRLIAKYGLEGYGLYNLILESITESLTTDSPIPDLQETCEDIAEFYNGNTAKINEIAKYMITQNLIEIDEITNRITCNKIYKYLEQSQTRSKQIRNMIASYKNSTKIPICNENNVYMTVSDKSERIEKNRIEKNRIEKNIPSHEKRKKFEKPTIQQLQQYFDERNIQTFTPDNFFDYYESKGWMIGKNKMVDWRAAVRTWLAKENKIIDKKTDSIYADLN